MGTPHREATHTFVGRSNLAHMGAGPSRKSIFSVELENSERDGWTKIHRSPDNVDELLCVPDAETKTLHDVVRRALKFSPQAPCFGTRKSLGSNQWGDYEWKSFQEVADAVDALAAGLRSLELVSPIVCGEDFSPHDISGHNILGIMSMNSEEWVMAEQAMWCNAACSCPLYDVFGPESVSFMINKTKMETCFTTADKIEIFIQAKTSCASLRNIIQMQGEVSESDRQKCRAVGIHLLSWSEVIQAGIENPRGSNTPPSPQSVATICFTSGTTGDPKGAMLSHAGFLASLAGGFSIGLILTNDDVHISYLPLSHVFEHIAQMCCFYFGARIGFYHGVILELMDDIAVLRPTLFCSAPRMYNRIYDKVMAQVQASGGVKAQLFHHAYASKKYYLEQGYFTHRLWDRLVFDKIKAKLGGRVRLMVTGSAPIAPHVMDFLRICFGCHIMEGYGQTESNAIVSLCEPNSIDSGHVGGPHAANEVALQSIPEMNYLSENNEGEVCFRGGNAFLGYYQELEKTKEAIDDDGWVHTGDVGKWLPNGTLKIIDRKKNIFKLSQGEYVAAEKIENVYARSALVAQSFVHGSSLESFLVAIVVPDFDGLRANLPSLTGTLSNADIAENASIRDAVLEDMIKIGKESGLKGFEQVKAIHLQATEFSVQSGLLTPTFKLKRNIAAQVYAQELAQIMGEGRAKFTATQK